MVEHNLAKVGVAGSSPVFRSQKKFLYKIENHLMRLSRLDENAKIAQLVEHNLAKVGVAGSSPVFRSTPDATRSQAKSSPDGGIGRRATLRG